MIATAMGAGISYVFYFQATMRELAKGGGNDGYLFELRMGNGEMSVEAEEMAPGTPINFTGADGRVETRYFGSRYDEVNYFMPMSSFLGFILFAAGFLTLVIYQRPITRVLKKGIEQVDEKTLIKAKSRILNLPWFSFILCWVMTLAFFINQAIWEKVYFKVLTFKDMSAIFLSAFCFGLISSSVVLAWFDLHLLKFIPQIYSGEELFNAKREGRSIKLGTKIFIMTFTTSIIPLCLLLYLNVTSNPVIKQMMVLRLQEKNARDYLATVPALMPLAFSALAVVYFIIIALIMSHSLRQGIIRPQELLIRRMAGVKDGNYDLKTTVFTNDEIGQLKSSFNEMLAGLRHREFIKDTFGKFMSIEVSRQILEEGKINLGGEEVEATVLFSDIRNFTPMSESMSPDEVVSFLNEYFAHTVKPILDERGVVNKYIGDCIMALFGVPEKIDDHADRALQAALRMRSALKEYNESRQEQQQQPVKIGIGIHSGLLVAGNIGAPERIEYTVIGDTVNVASRIESQTKDLAATILISQAVYDRLSGELSSRLEFERCPQITVKGKSEPLDLYKVL
ncbi:MAG: adenylate/guanylate cyclase domain-containing protein [bacterium]|nr:adenylate/guanylate cyclase domain-containing protein [bacterium]